MHDFLLKIIRNFMKEMNEIGTWWFVFGLMAQLSFTGRFLIQWIASERKGRSVVPIYFWYLSVVGGVMLFTYFVRRGDPIGALGQSAGIVVYVRNLMLIYKNPGRPGTAEGTA